MPSTTTSIEKYRNHDIKASALDRFIEKKPEFCSECGHWLEGRCGVGYKTHASTRACRQAISQQAMLKAGML